VAQELEGAVARSSPAAGRPVPKAKNKTESHRPQALIEIARCRPAFRAVQTSTSFESPGPTSFKEKPPIFRLWASRIATRKAIIHLFVDELTTVG
jgi:hypothetical protein